MVHNMGFRAFRFRAWASGFSGLGFGLQGFQV